MSMVDFIQGNVTLNGAVKMTFPHRWLDNQAEYRVYQEGDILIDSNEDIWIRVEQDNFLEISSYRKVMTFEYWQQLNEGGGS